MRTPEDQCIEEPAAAPAKWCPRCSSMKLTEDFALSKSAPDGRYGYCKTCAAEKTRLWRLEHPTAHQEYRAANRDKINARRSKTHRMRHLRDTWGLTTDAYQAMLDGQDGVCAICHRPPSDDSPLQIDHCHTTGRIRGLLCGSCNRAIGLLGDDICRLSLAIDYLTRNK